LEDIIDLLKREEDKPKIEKAPYIFEGEQNPWRWPYNDDPTEVGPYAEQWVAHGGPVGHAPWHKPTAQQPQGQPQQQQQPGPQGGAQSPGRGQPNPMKAPRGLPSLAPRTMDPAFMQQQAMQKMMMGQGQQMGQPRMGMAEGKKAKKKELPEELPPYQGPEYETDDAKEMGKEILRRYLGSGVMSNPIGGKFKYGVGYGKDKPFDYGIGYGEGDSGLYADYGIRDDGENVYSGGYKGDNWGFGVRKEEGGDPYFTFKKKFNQGGRIGLKEGSVRDRLQKDYESLTKGVDWMRTAPPKWWLFPEYDPIGHRDDTMTWFKERFMYGDLDAIPTPLEAFKKSPELVKFKKWLKERKEKANGGRVPMMYGGDPGFAFEYGGSWADWRDQHQHQMPVTDYIKTKLPKERLPFRDMQSGGIARLPLGLGSMSRRAFLKMLGALGIGTAAAKSGISLLSKTAPKAIKGVETITRGADGMPAYVMDLIEVVKAKGTRDFIEGVKRSDYSTMHSYKGVDVIEDGAGNIKIKSDKSGVSIDPYTGKTHEGIAQQNHIQINKGEYVKASDEGGKGSIKTADEYTEGTVYPDRDGKMKDFEEGLDEAIHKDFKEIADEIDTIDQHMWSGVKSDAKKASGGIAHMLGE